MKIVETSYNIEDLNSSEWIRVSNPKSWVLVSFNYNGNPFTFKRITADDIIWRHKDSTGGYLNISGMHDSLSETLEKEYQKLLRIKKLERIV